MDILYRNGTPHDLPGLKDLAARSWAQYQPALTPDNWIRLSRSLNDEQTYIDLLAQSECLVATYKDRIVGMAFLVPRGNPTEIYEKDWSYIRFVSVDPEFSGRGIGRQLTAKCIEAARQNGERTIALHTSEMMDAARHIYASLGFTVLREIDQRLGMRYWVYVLEL